ncbi:MAG: hypothetical protein EXR69_07160, partial [Myxococcales bacterium]|nr:hypothetical protein [Myxococcales bacterium]
PEVCDNHDNDCDGTVDVGALDAILYYADIDGDSFGDSEASTLACAAADGTVADASDCDDTDALSYPDAPELCDGADNDCDGAIDDGLSGAWYLDFDGDGYGDAAETVSSCGAPAGYVADDTDCDDADGLVYPEAPELCDALDNDCDGVVDDDAANTYFADADGDLYGDPSDTVASCSAPASYVSDSSDCDDADPNVNPGAADVCDGEDNDCDGTVDDDPAFHSIWYDDVDGDGYGDPGSPAAGCTQPANTVTNSDDCDDSHEEASPAGFEVCDGLDNDCDTLVDNSALDALIWYVDADADTYGGSETLEACAQPAGYVSTSTDCDDGAAAVHPGAAEICDDLDNDCDSGVDTDATDETTWYRDADADTFGGATSVTECDQPAGYVASGSDCDDSDSTIYPGADEYCDGTDNNCNTTIDDSPVDSAIWYDDVDGDGYGDPDGATTACTQPANTVTNADDCDDSHEEASPAGVEVCDGLDNDCDTLVDNSALDEPTWYVDADADTYGGVGSLDDCTQPPGYVSTSTDCDDDASAIHPGATEICDDVDNNCDSVVDTDAADITTWHQDTDNDSFGSAVSLAACDQPAGYVVSGSDCDDGNGSTYPGAAEVCDEVDNDCDSVIDDSPVDGTVYYLDFDGDTFGGPTTVTGCESPSGYVSTSTDCDDTDANSYPGSVETCDDLDNDCDLAIDDDAVDETAWYADADSDSYGDMDVSSTSCDAPLGHVADATDCDDLANAVYPGAPEYCNEVDDDCDLSIDEAGAVDETTWHLDADADSYGGTTSQAGCDQPAGYVADGTDCDDAQSTANPGASEVCEDGLDNDCDGDETDCRYTTPTPLTSIVTTSGGQTMYGAQTNDYFGTSVAGRSDVNGDASPDVIVGALGWDSAAGTNNYGKAYVWYGPLGASDTTATADVVFTAAENGEAAGSSVAFIPDYTGADGYAEILIGAWKRNGTTGTDSGGAYIFAGGAASATVTSARTTITGTTPNEAAGFVVLGGNFDGNGAGDFIVTAPANISGYPNAGSANLWYDGVAAGTVSISAAELRITGTTVGDFFGAALSSGDVDGDGVGDMVIGAYGVDSGTAADTGAAYFVFGDSSTGTLAAASAAIVFTNSTASERLGYSVAVLGDIDGDGYSELGLGADKVDDGTKADVGRVYLIDGAGVADGTTTGSVTATTVAAAKLTGSNAGDSFGKVLSNAGDFDDDGYSDFIVAAPGYDSGTSAEVGAYTLEYGTSAFSPIVSATWSMPGAGDGTATTTVQQPNAIGRMGDLNGDGYDDLGLTSGFTENGSTANSGAAWFVYGTGL